MVEDPILAQNSDFLKIQDKLKLIQVGTEDFTDKIDFVICLGGDGTLLYASLLFQVCIELIILSIFLNFIETLSYLEVCAANYGVPHGLTRFYDTF